MSLIFKEAESFIFGLILVCLQISFILKMLTQRISVSVFTSTDLFILQDLGKFLPLKSPTSNIFCVNLKLIS